MCKPIISSLEGRHDSAGGAYWQMMFDMLPGALGEEPVRLMYPELLKRLDDSSDVVRRAVCATISAFLRVSKTWCVRVCVCVYSKSH